MKILITGAGHGLGYELTRLFLSQGHVVFMTTAAEESAEKLEALETVAEQGGGQLIHLVMDVTKRGDIEAAARFWQDDLDVILNNAGILCDHDWEAGILDFDDEDWVRTLQVNAWGPAAVFRAFYPRLVPGGQLVTITSDAASFQNSGTRFPVYCISKAAANKLMSLIRAACPDNRVLSIHPGWINTPVLSRGIGAITAAEAADGVYRLITDRDSVPEGVFYTNTDGEQMPW